jgi:F0F1-type ATP synthase membrane subunit b/b'
MKETDLLNAIKQSEDEAQAIINDAKAKLDEIKKRFEENKLDVINEHKERLLEETKAYRTKKEEEFNKVVEGLHKEKDNKIAKLLKESKEDFDSIVQELFSEILELKWQ